MSSNLIHKYAPYHIADVGNRAGFGFLKGLHPHIRYTGFDPSAESQVKNKSFLSEQLLPVALNDSIGIFSFYESNHPSFSSLLQFDEELFDRNFGLMTNSETWKNYLTVKKQSSVEATTLDKIFSENNSGHIDYLKIDTQGSELNILKGAQTLLSNKFIKVIKVEVAFLPVYKNQALFQNIADYLHTYNFELADLELYPDTVYQKGNTALKLNNFKEKIRFGNGGDAIFYLNDPAMKTDEIIRQAIILAGSGLYSISYHLLKRCSIDKEEILNLFQYFIPFQKKKKFTLEQLKLMVKKVVY